MNVHGIFYLTVMDYVPNVELVIPTLDGGERCIGLRPAKIEVKLYLPVNFFVSA
jgi:hypothetical protein